MSRPSVSRAIFGAFPAALASATLSALVLGATAVFEIGALGLLIGWMAFLSALVIALGHALLLGVPLYLLLGWRWRIGRWESALWGFAIGVVPVTVLLWPESGWPAFHGWSLDDFGGRVTICGAAGAAGGYAFQRALVWLFPEPEEEA